MTAFQGHCAAEAGGLLFFPAGGTDLPVAAGDTGYERGVTFEAPYVSAGEAEPYGCIRDAFDPGAVNRVLVSAMRAGANGLAANRFFSSAVLFDSQQKGILKIIRKKFPHYQQSARYRLAHRKTPSSVLDFNYRNTFYHISWQQEKILTELVYLVCSVYQVYPV